MKGFYLLLYSIALRILSFHYYSPFTSVVAEILSLTFKWDVLPPTNQPTSQKNRVIYSLLILCSCFPRLPRFPHFPRLNTLPEKLPRRKKQKLV